MEMMQSPTVCSSRHLLTPSPRPPSPLPPSSSSLRSRRAGGFSSITSPNGVCFSSAWRRSWLAGLGRPADGKGIRVSAKGANGVPYAPNSASPHGPSVDMVSGSSGRMKLEPFGGKSGSVSFYGLTHHALEEEKLVSSPFKEGSGSLLWMVGPVALISALLLPQIFVSSAVEAVLGDEILAGQFEATLVLRPAAEEGGGDPHLPYLKASTIILEQRGEIPSCTWRPRLVLVLKDKEREIVSIIFSEAIFYGGLATFLLVADRVQRPYLEFSAKRWSLITGLKGYLSSAFFIMGLKVLVPLLAAYAAWPVIGLPALVSVAPFLLGCGVQFLFEYMLSRRGSSCWPLLPIIFEVYRLYQLSKAAHFIQRLMFSMRGSAVSPELLDRSGTLMSMFVVFQVLGIVCLWSLATFLIRLFPSRPVAENY